LDGHRTLAGKRRNVAITEANLVQNDAVDRKLTLVATQPLDLPNGGRTVGT
jgi:hypothetical protein